MNIVQGVAIVFVISVLRPNHCWFIKAMLLDTFLRNILQVLRFSLDYWPYLHHILSVLSWTLIILGSTFTMSSFCYCLLQYIFGHSRNTAYPVVKCLFYFITFLLEGSGDNFTAYFFSPLWFPFSSQQSFFPPSSSPSLFLFPLVMPFSPHSDPLLTEP